MHEPEDGKIIGKSESNVETCVATRRGEQQEERQTVGKQSGRHCIASIARSANHSPASRHTLASPFRTVDTS